MNTAVDDGLIKRNPCRIKGAGSEDSPERPVLSVSQVYALADAVGLRYRALILLAAFSSLRWSELAALRPEDIDPDRTHRGNGDQERGTGSRAAPSSRAAFFTAVASRARCVWQPAIGLRYPALCSEQPATM
jgi:integrase